MNIKSLLPCVAMLLALVGACSSEVNNTYCDSATKCESSAEASFCNIADNTCIAPPSAKACNSVEPCEDNALPFCAVEASGGVCVQCIDSTQCTGSDFCNQTTHACELFSCTPDSQGDALCAEYVFGLPYCGTSDTCTMCRESSHCDTALPVCDDVNFTCRSCELNSECASDLCESGSCVEELRFVYVASNGSPDFPCGLEDNPCSSVELAQQLATPTRKEIRISGGDYEGTVTITNQELILRAMGNVVFRYPPGPDTFPLLSVVGTSQVEVHGIDYQHPNGTENILVSCESGTTLLLNDININGGETAVVSECDLEIVDSNFRNQLELGVHVKRDSIVAIRGSSLIGNGATNRFSQGVRCDDGDVDISASNILDHQHGVLASQCDIRIHSSTVSNSRLAGLRISNSNFEIVNNFIVHNGESDSSFARGVDIESTVTNPNFQRFDFNTVAGNKGDSSSINMKCSLSPNAPMVALGNILWDAVPIGSNVDLSNCSFASSSVEGVTNFAPEFVNPIVGPTGNYHLKSNSQCIDRVDTTTLDIDFDGDMRPMGIRHDMGADEAQ